MKSPSKNSSSLKKKFPSTEKSTPLAGATVKRPQQSHTRAQREDFLSAVARLGSVAAAAEELGINRSTCQKWANAAGIRPQRLYTQADKDHFYAVLDRTGTITATAQELGLNISTAHNWAGKVNPAGRKRRATKTVKPGPAQRQTSAVIEEFLGLLREVGSVSAAARQLGLNHSTCYNWARAARSGLRQSATGIEEAASVPAPAPARSRPQGRRPSRRGQQTKLLQVERFAGLEHRNWEAAYRKVAVDHVTTLAARSTDLPAVSGRNGLLCPVGTWLNVSPTVHVASLMVFAVSCVRCLAVALARVIRRARCALAPA